MPKPNKNNRYNQTNIKKNKKVFHTGSGTIIGIGKRFKDRIIKVFPPAGGWPRNEVSANSTGRKMRKPITNHKAISYYSKLMHDAYWKPHDRRFEPTPKVKHFRVRPVKLIREGSNYHVTERVNGPNLDDFVSHLLGHKMKKLKTNDERQSDMNLRRKGLAQLLKKNKKEVLEFKKNLKDFREEFMKQIDHVQYGAGSEYTNIYNANLKESDFIVEGFERDKNGELRIKLVMVDFQ
jgi:hypothetical protein